MAKRFPKFQAHTSATCFNCEADLDGSYPRESGYAKTRGQWAQDCRKCRMTTWYDLKRAKKS